MSSGYEMHSWFTYSMLLLFLSTAGFWVRLHGRSYIFVYSSCTMYHEGISSWQWWLCAKLLIMSTLSTYTDDKVEWRIVTVWRNTHCSNVSDCLDFFLHLYRICILSGISGLYLSLSVVWFMHLLLFLLLGQQTNQSLEKLRSNLGWSCLHWGANLTKGFAISKNIYAVWFQKSSCWYYEFWWWIVSINFSSPSLFNETNLASISMSGCTKRPLNFFFFKIPFE